jgi:macrolide-specific efflux system membrane fusion protein
MVDPEGGPERPEESETRQSRATPPSRRRRSRNKSQWGMIAVVLVVLGIAVYLVWSVVGPKKSATQYITAQPTRGTLTVAVAGNGNVVSKSQASVNPGISGTVTQLSVSLGSKVTKGDVLFVIDNTALDANVKQAKSSYQSAKASTLKAKQAETQADVSLETGVKQAYQALEQAQASVANARAAVTKAETAVPYSEDAYEAASHTLSAAEAGQATAEENYEHACKIQREGHAAAAVALSAAHTAQDASYEQYQQSITNADQRTVVAPIDGYITTLSINNGDQLGSTSSGSTSSSRSSGAGGGSSSSSSNSAPIVISDLSRLQAQVAIAETDRPSVKLGQKVELTFDAVPNLTISGRVTQIDAVGTSSSGVVTYNVTISFDVQDKRLNPGMTASASIITRVDTNVLMVPNSAIKTDTSGASYVQVLDTPNGTPRDVTVTVGPAGETDTEIVSGLTGNENVVTQTISATSGSSSTGRTGLSVLGGGGGFRGGAGGIRGN